MVLTVVINTVFAFAFIICLLYTLGNVDAVLNSTSLPILTVFYGATNSVGATNVLMVFIIIVSIVGDFSVFASVSRLTWAFARDRGLPFSEFFAYVSNRFERFQYAFLTSVRSDPPYPQNPNESTLLNSGPLRSFGTP